MKELAITLALFGLIGCGDSNVTSHTITSFQDIDQNQESIAYWDNYPIAVNADDELKLGAINDLNHALGFDLYVDSSDGIDINYFSREYFINTFNYAPQGLTNAKVDDFGVILSAEIFINSEYQNSIHNTLVHELIHASGYFKHDDARDDRYSIMRPGGFHNTDYELSELISDGVKEFLSDYYE